MCDRNDGRDYEQALFPIRSKDRDYGEYIQAVRDADREMEDARDEAELLAEIEKEHAAERRAFCERSIAPTLTAQKWAKARGEQL